MTHDGGWRPHDHIYISDDDDDEQNDTPAAKHPRSVRMRRSERICQCFCISARAYRQLRRAVLPLIFWQLLFFISSTNVPLPPIRLLDYYAGQGLILEEALKRGVAGLSFEINDNKIMEDALTPQGQITQFVFALRLQEHYQSLAHWGTVCSSWIWMSRSSTGRAIVQPLGDRWSDSARAGNIMVSRMTLVLYLLVAKRVLWIVEQPSSSLMFLHPRLAQFRRWAGDLEVTTAMADFGGNTSKPTTLRGSPPWLPQLERKISAQTRNRLRVEGHALADVQVDEQGRKHVTGNANLKGSQAYPRGYATTVAEHLATQAVAIDSSSSESDYEDNGYSSDWEDLNLNDVRPMIGQRVGDVPFPLV